MKLIFNKYFNDNDRTLLTKCGYREFRPPAQPAVVSYVRVLARSGWYPRFHVYIERPDNQLVLNLHLDQKKETYRGSGAAAHSGDYDDSSPAVTAEARRLTEILNHLP